MAKKNNLKLDGIRVVVFDFMNYLKIKMLESGEMKKHLWTKSTVLF